MFRITRNAYTHQLNILRDGTPLDGGYDTMDAAMAMVRKHIAAETPASPQPTRAERRQAVQLHADEARVQKLSNGRSGIARATRRTK